MTLHTYIPQDRLRAVARGEALPDRRNGSVLFADISGFTALTQGLRESLGARRGAEELTKHLSTVYTALIAEVEKYGGSVINFAGDAILCWFDDGHGSAAPRDRLQQRGNAQSFAHTWQRGDGIALPRRGTFKRVWADRFWLIFKGFSKNSFQRAVSLQWSADSEIPPAPV